MDTFKHFHHTICRLFFVQNRICLCSNLSVICIHVSYRFPGDYDHAVSCMRVRYPKMKICPDPMIAKYMTVNSVGSQATKMNE